MGDSATGDLSNLAIFQPQKRRAEAPEETKSLLQENSDEQKGQSKRN